MWGWCSDSEWWNRHMLNVYNSRQIFFLPTVLEGSGLENNNCEILFPSPMRTCCPKKTKERRAYTFSKWIYYVAVSGRKHFYALHCFPQFPVPAVDCLQVSLNLWLQIKPHRDHKSVLMSRHISSRSLQDSEMQRSSFLKRHLSRRWQVLL